jgi:uncharacterized protein YycO
MQQEKLRYVFSRSWTPYSALIRAYPPNGPYSHCGIVLPDDTVIESLAIKNGVVSTSLDDFVKRNTRVSLMEVPAPKVKEANEWALESIGQDYDWLYVAAIPFRLRGKQKEGKVACSEHCGLHSEVGGLDIFIPGMHGLTPNHLVQLLYAAGGRFTKEIK